MIRPDFITKKDIERWSDNINNDKSLPKDLINFPIIREVCFAGLWLCEELDKLFCPKELITRIQFTAGRASFGNDIWQVHQQFLNSYINNELCFMTDLINLN